MIINYYLIFDKKSKLYSKPFYLLNDNIARRTAQNLLDDPNTEMNKAPDDFSMWRAGSFNDETGKFENLEEPECVIQFHHMVKTPTEEQLGLFEMLEALNERIEAVEEGDLLYAKEKEQQNG